MPNIVADTAVLLKKLNAEFFNQINGAKQAVLEPLANVVKSDTVSTTYPINVLMPGIREWLDKIEYSDGKIFEYTIKNKGWQSGFQEDRLNYTGINNNLSGALNMNIQQAVGNWVYFKDKLIADILLNNPTAFDGTALFADTRPNIDTGSYTADNIVSGTGTTVAQITADLDDAIEQLYGMKDKDGNPFNVGGQLAIIAPRHLWRTFESILNYPGLISVGGVQVQNVWASLAKLYINDYQLTTNNDWYLVNMAAPFKPFIIQEMQTPTYEMEDKKSDRFIKFFATSFTGYGAGNPFSIVKVDN